MKRTVKLSIIFCMFLLTFALLANAKAQTATDNMKTFFDFDFPGVKIQVNATAEVKPTEEITVICSLQQTKFDAIYIQYFNLSIFGFLRGKDKLFMANITQNSTFQLTNVPQLYNYTFEVPENVWDITYGEIMLTYSAKYATITVAYDELGGFSMTYIENVYLKNLEELLDNLNITFRQSFQMNLTLENLAKLNETYWRLQGSVGDLDNTRKVVAILAITTVFFVATTVYVVWRKPKEYW